MDPQVNGVLCDFNEENQARGLISTTEFESSLCDVSIFHLPHKKSKGVRTLLILLVVQGL